MEEEERFENIEKLGEGVYGTVHKVKDKQKNQIVTLKKIKFLDKKSEGIPYHALREITALQLLKHPNIVNLLKVHMPVPETIHLIFEFVDMDLTQYMVNHETRKIPVKKIMKQLLQGIEYAHARHILHRDLKPRNILIDKETHTVKIADMGLARIIHPSQSCRYTPEIVTLHYRAPELLLDCEKYSPALDIWSLGCIFFELQDDRNDSLFEGRGQIDQLFTIFKLLGTPNESSWPGISKLEGYRSTFLPYARKSLQEKCPNLDDQGLDLLSQMLILDPSQRITAKRALLHPYFENE